MATSPSLPVVLLRLSCADEAEFSRSYASRFASKGVFIPTSRLRPVGTRVRLKVELLDGTIASSLDAVVESLVNEDGKRPGYHLRVAEVGSGVAPPTGGEVPAPPAAGQGLEARTPPPDPGARARLEEFLFSDPPPPPPAPAPVSPPASETDWSDVAAPDPAPAPVRAREPAPEPEPEPEFAPAPEVELAPAAAPVFDSTPEAAPEATPEARPLQPAAGPALSRGLAGRAWIAVALGIVVAVVVVALVVSQVRARGARTEAAFAAEILAADGCLRAGRLAGPGADTALAHLVAARRLEPDDRRLTTRIALVADKLEELGRHALARADRGEAQVHFEAALLADPGRRSASDAMQQIASGPDGRPGGGARP